MPSGSSARFGIRRCADAEEFLARAGPWLLRAEAENNLILGLAARLRGPHPFDAPVYLGIVERGAEIVGCVMRTPPFKLLLTSMPVAAGDAVAADVAEVYDSVPSVHGPADIAGAVAERLAARRPGSCTRVGHRQRIYELDHLIPPAHPPQGSGRVASMADLPLVAGWVTTFSSEVGMPTLRGPALTQERIGQGEMFLWIDGEPVALAGWSGKTPNGVRIGYVYTPARLRGRGYASALTAFATQRAFEAGYRFCFLYTDLANPISNSIYQRLGYTPVTDVSDHVIEPC